ncbi:uncharacterized protein A1O5_00331 [Cladophialophora psammophila CBS 110553]|uniref:Xylanolytic transcriptional activator regulatory domain-containing protein n=1 Tax=Cladophialophora psammophila CBS 110553 TaxID=1182543 RepID=W9XZY7_9EURO|nr:uncharacterized protein A1O5_00331 [Cladophialophora psammophila CBS 110553]EXJ75824.1 hypothetical protein A1O5_00331 [Cladophialophora psammophila CBS 110553]
MASASILDSDPLAFKALDIVSRVKEATMLKPRNSIIPFTWSAMVEETCLRFFSPSNLSKFIEWYWISWYPHWPVIHKPTFQASATPSTLVAAMVLIGASYSPEQADRDDSRMWLNVIEELVFTDEYFCDDVDMITASDLHPSTVQRRRLQALQAAHAMCLCQAYEGDDNSKRRARHHRMNAVVALARAFGFAQGKHTDLRDTIERGFSWSRFVEREELIRTLIYVFALDSGFLIFYNLPPKLVVQEATVSLICPEACFQAHTAAECEEYVRMWTSHRLYSPNFSLSSAIEILCSKQLSPDHRDLFVEIGSVNLLIIAAVFNSMAFHFRPALGQIAELVPLQHAISHWGEIWAARPPPGMRSAFGTSSTEPVSFTSQREMWKRLGFMKHAHEFWMLSRIIVERLVASQRHVVHAGDISDHARRQGQVSGEIPDQYDRGDMNQLRTLILGAIRSTLSSKE